MKKILIVIAMLLVTFILHSQETVKRDIIVQKTTPMLHLNGLGGNINFYNGDVRLTHGANELNVDGGRLDVNDNIKIGSSSSLTMARIDLIANRYYIIASNGDTVSPHTEASELIDGDTIWPNISSGVVAPTAITPGKIGDIYINTSTSKVYIATTLVAGGWSILN